MPVWVAVAALLYAAAGLVVAPTQLTGASVEAMVQANPDQALLPPPHAVENACPFMTPVSAKDNQVVKAQMRVSWQQICRRPPRLRRRFPFLRFIPPTSLRDSSA
jgi:hypothetical protein